MSLVTHSLSRNDRGTKRIDSLSLQFEPGQFTAIVGPNGSGKSSLLELLSGTLHPSFGRISLDGIDLRNWDRRELAKTRAVLPQDVPPRLPYLASEVVALGRAPHEPESPQKRDSAIQLALAQVGLLEQASLPYSQLSGGQRARVQLARCLSQLTGAAPAPVLLLDEPTASLDPKWQHASLALARNLTELGWCVICVLHDLNLACRYAHRLILLDKGRLILDDTTAKAIQDRRLDQTYELDFHRTNIGDRTLLSV